MPLPTPLPQTLSNKSLLFHPRVAEEAQNLLGVRDDALVPQLVHSLVQTSASHIEVKDHYAGTEPRVDQQEGMPELLRAVLDTNPNVFSGAAAVNLSQPQWNHTGQPTVQASPSNCNQTSPNNHNTPQSNPTSPASAQTPTSVLQRPSVITEQKPAASVLNCHNTYISQKDSSNQNPHCQESETVQYNQQENSTTELLRQHRRPARGPSPAQASDAPMQTPVPAPYATETNTTKANVTTSAKPEVKVDADQTNSISNSTSDADSEKADNTKQTPNTTGTVFLEPYVKLQRLSVEDAGLIQKSITKFIETRPNLAKSLGISAPKHGRSRGDKSMNLKEESDSDSDESPKKSKKDKKNYAEDDDYAPDIFSALAGTTKKRKNTTKDEKPEPVMIVKPKLRRVEKEDLTKQSNLL
ncbi:hypothetical protein ILUMI_22137 [Ignelater luminosus]|uniref:Uncharacterized protein n=1 Tax=Ignelater luminosus TaxID=2038154 RepID=A0A8K0CB57_IGNLU|nr:hypothetical protein ILUMI_22137 [Ignelater luminosus]